MITPRFPKNDNACFECYIQHRKKQAQFTSELSLKHSLL